MLLSPSNCESSQTGKLRKRNRSKTHLKEIKIKNKQNLSLLFSLIAKIEVMTQDSQSDKTIIEPTEYRLFCQEKGI